MEVKWVDVNTGGATGQKLRSPVRNAYDFRRTDSDAAHRTYTRMRIRSRQSRYDPASWREADVQCGFLSLHRRGHLFLTSCRSPTQPQPSISSTSRPNAAKPSM